MKANELKKLLEPPFSIGKSFSPITEYLFVKAKIKSTDLESFIEVIPKEEMPFQGCVLKEPLSKFLNSVDKNTELNFEVKVTNLSFTQGVVLKIAITPTFKLGL